MTEHVSSVQVGFSVWDQGDGDEDKDTGTVLRCGICGYVDMWDEEGWAIPAVELGNHIVLITVFDNDKTEFDRSSGLPPIKNKK